jgi:hypothetical protein
MEMMPEPLPETVQNPNGLRVARTVYTLKDLNEARSSGNICILRQRIRNPNLESHELMLRNRENSEYVIVPDRTVYRQYGRGVQEYPDSEWELIFETVTYGRANRRSYIWGAYILPSDALHGESFLITDLIEDLLAANFWYQRIAAETAEAVWNGRDLIISPGSYEQILVG